MTGTDTALSEEILRGLRGRPRSLPCKLFYDATGSRLFERICGLESYYPTRTELAILEERLAAIARRIGPGAEIVEFGSGSGRKTRLLVEALDAPSGLCLIEISQAALDTSLAHLRVEFPGLTVHGVQGDYTNGIHLPAAPPSTRRRVVFFPGSTIGNFTPQEAIAFLERARRLAGREGMLVLGTDMVKDAAVLEAAYDDPEGVTAAFNRNILTHCNHLLDGDIDPTVFAHRAPWDPIHRRIDMLLEAREDTSFTLAGERFDLVAGETIHTEHSHKYRPEDVAELASAAGWELTESWYDGRGWFGVHVLAG